MKLPASFCFTASLVSAQVAVLTHATLIDGRGGPPVNDVSIIMSGQVIQDIGPWARVKTPAGSKVIDCSGKTVVPGIINLHAHVGENTEFKIRQFALYGNALSDGEIQELKDRYGDRVK